MFGSEDFNATGFVNLADAAKYRKPDELKIQTPSGKIEIISEKLENQGLPPCSLTILRSARPKASSA